MPADFEWEEVARRREPADLPVPWLDNRYSRLEEAAFVYAQITPSTEWEVVHNLGRPVIVLVILDDGTISEGEIRYSTDYNTVWVLSEYLITGKAYCF